jgi:hypothetical protein
LDVVAGGSCCVLLTFLRGVLGEVLFLGGVFVVKLMVDCGVLTDTFLLRKICHLFQLYFYFFPILGIERAEDSDSAARIASIFETGEFWSCAFDSGSGFW